MTMTDATRARLRELELDADVPPVPHEPDLRRLAGRLDRIIELLEWQCAHFDDPTPLPADAPAPPQRKHAFAVGDLVEICGPWNTGGNDLLGLRGKVIRHDPDDKPSEYKVELLTDSYAGYRWFPESSLRPHVDSPCSFGYSSRDACAMAEGTGCGGERCQPPARPEPKYRIGQQLVTRLGALFVAERIEWQENNNQWIYHESGNTSCYWWECNLHPYQWQPGDLVLHPEYGEGFVYEATNGPRLRVQLARGFLRMFDAEAKLRLIRRAGGMG